MTRHVTHFSRKSQAFSYPSGSGMSPSYPIQVALILAIKTSKFSSGKSKARPTNPSHHCSDSNHSEASRHHMAILFTKTYNVNKKNVRNNSNHILKVRDQLMKCDWRLLQSKIEKSWLSSYWDNKNPQVLKYNFVSTLA